MPDCGGIGKNGAMAIVLAPLPGPGTISRPAAARGGTLPRARVALLGRQWPAAHRGSLLLAAASSGLASISPAASLTPARGQAGPGSPGRHPGGARPADHPRRPPPTPRRGRLRLLFRRRPRHRPGRQDHVLLAARKRTVLREVEQVYSGDLAAAGAAGGAVPRTPTRPPRAAGEDVQIEVDGGTAPAWLVRAESEAGTWAIMVHGRGASRQEGLRAVRAARELGLSSLLISYRNDGLAPSAPDGRYGLGSTEWRDVEAAIELCPGARRPRGGAVRLVDGRGDLPPDRGPVAAPPPDPGHGAGRPGDQLGQCAGAPRGAEPDPVDAVGRYGQLMLSQGRAAADRAGRAGGPEERWTGCPGPWSCGRRR